MKYSFTLNVKTVSEMTVITPRRPSGRPAPGADEVSEVRSTCDVEQDDYLLVAGLVARHKIGFLNTNEYLGSTVGSRGHGQEGHTGTTFTPHIVSLCYWRSQTRAIHCYLINRIVPAERIGQHGKLREDIVINDMYKCTVAHSQYGETERNNV